MPTYTVTLANSFDAETPEDAVRQMVAYAADNAYQAGYRVTNDDDSTSIFIDADDIFL